MIARREKELPFVYLFFMSLTYSLIHSLTPIYGCVFLIYMNTPVCVCVFVCVCVCVCVCVRKNRNELPCHALLFFLPLSSQEAFESLQSLSGHINEVATKVDNCSCTQSSSGPRTPPPTHVFFFFPMLSSSLFAEPVVFKVHLVLR